MKLTNGSGNSRLCSGPGGICLQRLCVSRWTRQDEHRRQRSRGKGETVGDATAIGGNVDVRGHVTGDAPAIGGSITIQSAGSIDGSANAIGGSVVIREPGSHVGGETVNINGPLRVPRLTSLLLTHHADGWISGVVCRFVAGLLSILVAVLIAAIWPERTDMAALQSCRPNRAGRQFTV